MDYSKFENIDYDSDDDEDMEGSPRPLVTGCDCDICAVKGAQCSSGCERGHSDVDRAEIESTKIRNIFVEAAAAAMYEANKDKIVKGGILRGFLSGAKISSDTDVPSMNVAADNKGLGSSGFRINRPAAINADDATDSDDDDSSLPSLVTGVERSLLRMSQSSICNVYHHADVEAKALCLWRIYTSLPPQPLIRNSTLQSNEFAQLPNSWTAFHCLTRM